ncbi:MAG: RagB/SusD family nutrient uptake outer membrane protein [Bacteroidales bacterium]|nr:RagB/SusD family nutrient uptake outer membrane protein [Bacteroidales bacterium]HPS24486.1 RagB/SusD family nutrient uptake outer membrane protein [Bacteroidales bacterium]
MKKIIFLALAATVLFTSCEAFLDTESYTKKNTGNYPKTADDAIQMVTGVYATLNKVIANCGNSYYFAAQLLSDDMFGGGGENDKDWTSLEHLMYTNLDRFKSFWSDRYSGISRANMALANLDKVEDETLRNQLMGETLFLRALFYFELVQMFGDVPLITTVPQTVAEVAEYPEQAPQKDIYAFIAADLKKAVTIMPTQKWNEIVSGEGHATRWAAEALLARVFLFYTGFYGEAELPMMDEEFNITGSVTKAEVITALEDCINNSGHTLADDYRRLWPYTNSVSAKNYDYLADLNASRKYWLKDGENPETLFAIKCSHLASWGTTIGYSNQYCLFFGIRNAGTADQYKNVFPFGQGWGAGPANPKLWDEWKAKEPNDLRRKASILAAADRPNYVYGADKLMEESTFWQKKVIAITAYKNETDLFNSFTSSTEYYGDGEADDFQLAHETDLILIRFADVLLMHSELTETAESMNRVRARAGLSPVSYSFEALQNERRWELAFEGLRWGDMRRWGDTYAINALTGQLGANIWNRAVATVMKDQGAGYAARYQATKGFMPMPSSEVDLSNGVLQQNAGWGTDAIFVSWNE